MKILPLHTGFPARTHRGYLGLSSAYLVLGERVLLYDTLGFGEREGLLERMRALGVAPERVELLVLSHLHFDHAANLDLFPWAQVVVHRLELEHAEAVAQSPHRDPACLYAYLPLLQARRTKVVEGEGEALMPGARLLHLPGHTPGLLGVWVEGVGALVSDAIKSRFDLEGEPAPPSWDPIAAKKTRERLLSYPRLFPGHDVPLRREGNSFVPEGQAALGIRLANATEVHLAL
ncbi:MULTISPECIES: MBL fold metallo-hydrolase [Thermus]|uniref:Zn-dependent hydrolase n=1 Tax=Thermus brockianus TaxID=56956 RepID=A0A1J0LXJ9_THEBO|nr:MBL fold metallo-hydrolase [Thermus brockianus]APD10339.1 Zn-dependent hydrolase [Thermus brockianus]